MPEEDFDSTKEKNEGFRSGFGTVLIFEDMEIVEDLQHYTELIVEDVKAEWDVPEDWRFVAQMPFGNPVEEPDEKEYEPLEERIEVYK